MQTVFRQAVSTIWFPLNLRGDIKDFITTCISSLRYPLTGTDRPNNKINYNTKGNRIQDNHITLEELDAYRKAHPERYEELRQIPAGYCGNL